MKYVNATHGVICNMPHDQFGYFGWPSIARMANGTLVAGSSGFRAAHICPWGKIVLHFSMDNGCTWTDPVTVNDSPIDDRDAGIISLGGQKLLLSWFASDTRIYWKWTEEMREKLGTDLFERYMTETHSWDKKMIQTYLGSWIMLSNDGRMWDDPIPVPVFAPHGPIRLACGNILYLGKAVQTGTKSHQGMTYGPIQCALSKDEGQTWSVVGEIPIDPDTENSNYYEPHVVELSSCKLVGLIRYQHSTDVQKFDKFTIFQSDSYDGGKTWTEAKATGAPGSPPHLMRHSSGAVVCVHGHRKKPYGEWAMISYDDCQTWEKDIVLRDDGPDDDLGYPSSIELSDGSILTVYYQKKAVGENNSILWTRWSLPN